MTNAQLDRRLREWLTDREPGPVPSSLREGAAGVPFEVRRSPFWRVWPGAVPAVGLAAGRPAVRPALALVVLGLVVAAAVTVIAVGSPRTPRPVPGLTSWGAFTVGQPAPPIVMHNVAGTPAVGDDATFEFEDRIGSVLVVFVPQGSGRDALANFVATLVDARARAPRSVVFLVATAAPEADRVAVATAADAGVGAVALPASWAPKPVHLVGDAVVVIDRHGRVATVFGGELPGADQLIEVIDREVGP